jgi:PIN domain nuclease of toxin-antitoxin system
VKLLLDTHILIWWASGDRKLSKSLRSHIASSENDVAISAASFWEIAIKSHLGRIDLDLEELRAAVRADGFDELPVQVEHTLRLRDLPDHHQDPFDRLLIAQSIAEGQRLVTRDKAVLAYVGVAGFNPLAGL